MAIKNLKCRAGEFAVFHIGKQQYVVERNGEALGQFPNLSRAYDFASRQHDAAKAEAA
jgi:hypothetical protein